jgi:hypothetical protein
MTLIKLHSIKLNYLIEYEGDYRIVKHVALLVNFSFKLVGYQNNI